MSADDLQVLPSVGPAVAGMLMRAGVEHPDDLAGWTAEQLYRRVCEVDDRRHDSCLLDTFVAVMDHAGGAPPRPWWYYSRRRIGSVQGAAGLADPKRSSRSVSVLTKPTHSSTKTPPQSRKTCSG